MDILETLLKIPEKLIELLTFFGIFFSDLFFIAFRPKKFVQGFDWAYPQRKLYTKSFLFLLTFLFVLEAITQIIGKFLDAEVSIRDIGISTALQSRDLWDISWEALVYDTVPVVVLIFFLAWLLSRICTKDPNTRKKLLIIFPYVIWRLVVQFFVLLLLSALVFVVVAVIVLIFFRDIILMVFLFYQYVLFGLIIVSILLTVARSREFVTELITPIHPIRSKFAFILFRMGVLISLVIPIWWASVELASPASKIAISPEDVLIDTSKNITATVSLRNLSNEKLYTSDKSNFILWWDDENPVMRSSFFLNQRVPNGRLYVKTVDDKELTDRYEKFIFTGNKKKKMLT